MRLGSFLVSVMAVTGLLIATQACALVGGNDDATKEDKLCTPGAFVFCRCADRAEGTKLCKGDGKSFDACQTSGDGECVGGEIPDPQTNTEIPGSSSGNPDPQQPDPPGAIETCPGKSTTVQPGVDLKIEGDTTTALNDREGKLGACAVGAGGKDHIYRLIPSGSGSLEVKVQGIGTLNPLAYMRTTCEDKESQVVCGPPGPNALAQFKTNVITGKEYFLIVDGASASVGKYAITAKLTTGAFCGDGKVDPGEACDDGPTKVDGDGCSNDCRHFDGNPTTGASCPGQPIDLWTGSTFTGTGSTTAPGYGNAWTNPSTACSLTGTNSFADHIYELTPHASGTVTVTVTPTGSLNFMLNARKTCSDPNSATASMCKNDTTATSVPNTETMTLSATANTKLYVAVDGGGVSSNKGDYTISFKLQ